MSSVTFVPTEHYSQRNHYIYEGKPLVNTLFDYLSLPLRTALGGKGVDLVKRDLEWLSTERGSSLFVQLGCIAISLYFYRISACIAAVWGARYFLGEREQLSRTLIDSSLLSDEGGHIAPDPSPLAEDHGDSIRLTISSEIKAQDYPIAEDTFAPGSREFNFRKYAYNAIRNGLQIDDTIQISTLPHLYLPVDDQQKVFEREKGRTVLKQGGLSFPMSTESVMHWTGNMLQSNYFPQNLGGAEDWISREEITALEHPALFHLGIAIRANEHLVNSGGPLLVTGAKCYGRCNVPEHFWPQIPNMSEERLEQYIMRYDNPRESNLFFLYPELQTNAPLTVDSFDQIFYAFDTIKKQAGTKNVEIHIDVNFRQNLFQEVIVLRAAARMAGIDVLNFHFADGNTQQTVKRACAYFAQEERQSPECSIEQFLTHLQGDL